MCPANWPSRAKQACKICYYHHSPTTYPLTSSFFCYICLMAASGKNPKKRNSLAGKSTGKSKSAKYFAKNKALIIRSITPPQHVRSIELVSTKLIELIPIVKTKTNPTLKAANLLMRNVRVTAPEMVRKDLVGNSCLHPV